MHSRDGNKRCENKWHGLKYSKTLKQEKEHIPFESGKKPVRTY